MIAMVLAAGLGTRLRPLTAKIPKPALPLLGSTLLEENLRLVAKLGVTEVVVNAHHLPERVAKVARDAASRLSLRLHLSFEAPEVLGTGGALVAAKPLLSRGETLLLVNGDVLTDLDLEGAKRAHEDRGAAATMVLRPLPAGGEFAPVEVDEDGLVARIAGLGREKVGPLSPYLFTGIHFLGPQIFDVLPEGPSCINRQGHVALLERGEEILGYLAGEGRWSDVGTPERYQEANLDLLDGRYRLRGFEKVEGIFVAADSVVEPGATLEGPCWIGPGAIVEATAAVGPRAVVLEGARVTGRLKDAVAFPPAG